MKPHERDPGATIANGAEQSSKRAMFHSVKSKLSTQGSRTARRFRASVGDPYEIAALGDETSKKKKHENDALLSEFQTGVGRDESLRPNAAADRPCLERPLDPGMSGEPRRSLHGSRQPK